jgi:hypothetical protein
MITIFKYIPLVLFFVLCILLITANLDILVLILVALASICWLTYAEKNNKNYLKHSFRPKT